MEGEEGQWRRRKQRMLSKHEGKLLSRDDFFYMTANSGNTPSPTSRKLEDDEKAPAVTAKIPDVSNMNKGSSILKNNRDRNLTPTP